MLDRAFEVQALLAERGQYRLAIPDLIIAAAADAAGRTVLHDDADVERIAEVTGQAHDWVVQRGSVQAGRGRRSSRRAEKSAVSCTRSTWRIEKVRSTRTMTVPQLLGTDRNSTNGRGW